MDRSMTSGTTVPPGNRTNAFPDAAVENAAKGAHQVVDKVADKATEQVDRLSGTVHRAVNTAADAATSTAEWAATIPEQAQQVQAKLTDAACASIRARPLSIVAGAAAIGYLFGRIAGRRTS